MDIILIEMAKKELMKTASKHGRQHPFTVALSQHLDTMIVKIQRKRLAR